MLSVRTVITAVVMVVIFAAFACGQEPAMRSAREPLQGADELFASSPSDRTPACGNVLQPLVEAKMAELGVPGVIILVDLPGTCRWVATLGRGDVTKRAPMLRSDHMRVGSITKTFTGTAVLQLVDEEAIGLDDPISRHLPGVPNGEAITIRQLLQMTSGLYNYSEDIQFNAALDADPQRVWSLPELLDIAYAHPPYFPPGASFHYSNTNSVLLGLLVEKVTGNPLGQELDRRIFRPLKMNHTSFPDLDDSSIPRPHPRGYMYGTNVGTLPPACDAETVGRHDVTDASPSWTWAAGGAISTLHDLTIWARALALGTLLTPKTQAERLQWIPTDPPPAPLYGLHITNFNGIIGHDGALPGFQSFIGYVPEKDATIVVLANLYPDLACGGPADAIVKLVARELHLFTGSAGDVGNFVK